MKYPSAVVGAIAASAPVWQFTGLASEYVYSNITTRTFASASEVCSNTIAKSWDTMTALSQSAAGLTMMTGLDWIQ
jgi:lysosomal Pro-X carboxypeptidase